MKHVDIIIGGHLATAPRAIKEAEALVRAGFSVSVHGAFAYDRQLRDWDAALSDGKRWTYHPIIDVSDGGLLPRSRALLCSLKRRIGAELLQTTTLETKHLLGIGIDAMLRRARKLKADLTIAHSEGGMWVATELLRKGQRVGVDFEDWFSEDLLPAARRTRPVRLLRKLERSLLQKASYSVAASKAMSAALAEAYNARPPEAVYNAFDVCSSVEESPEVNPCKFVWFSQTIGPGRGLEALMNALAANREANAEIHVIGDFLMYERWFRELIPDSWTSRVFKHPRVEPWVLTSYLRRFDVGLALESPNCRSRDLTVTNKLLQYMSAGLPVIATATAGQREVLDKRQQCGILVPPDDSVALGEAIRRVAESAVLRKRLRGSVATNANDQFGIQAQLDTITRTARAALEV